MKQFTHKSTTTKTQSKLVHAADYVDVGNSSVSWTEQGRLVGDDKRRAVRVTVSANERKVELLDGYNETVEKTVVQPNNKTAYTSFLIALENLHFGQERIAKQTDERGVCPIGQRYIYEIRAGANQKSRLWSDSCLATDGTFAGLAGTTRQLFKSQITTYDKFILGTQF